MLKLPTAKMPESKSGRNKNKAFKSSGKYKQSGEKDFKAENIELATYVPKYTASDEYMFQLFLTEH